MYPNHKLSLHRLLGENNCNVEERGIPLSQMARLPGCDKVTLALDGNKILDVITKEVKENDPVSVYTISTSLMVYECVNNYSDTLEKLKHYFGKDAAFKGVFVFNGCGFTATPDLNSTPPSQPCDEILRCSARSHATSVLLPPDVAQRCAERFSIEEDVEALIVRRLGDNKESDTLRAPYLAWSQISSFFAPSNRYASEVYGCVELLAFPGIDRVITNINVESNTFDCVTKASVLAAARKKYPDFSEADIAALLLFESKNKHFFVRGVPEIFDDFARTPSKPNSPWHRTDTFLSSNSVRISSEQRALLRRNLAALDAPVLCAEDAKCVTLSSLYSIPKRSIIREAFGRPLPSLFYYFLMAGLVMPAPFASLGQLFVEDGWPLVDTKMYRLFAEVILPLRVQVSFQLCQFIRQKVGDNEEVNMKWLRQYLFMRNSDGTVKEDPRIANINDPPTIVLTSWDVYSTLPGLQEEEEDKNVYFKNVLPYAGRSYSGPGKYDNVQSTVAATLLKSLDLLGYFTHATDETDESAPSIYSKALKEFTCPTLSEYGVLIIEMARTRVLSGIIPVPSVSETSHEKYPRHVWLAASLLSVIPINSSAAWSGPFDPSMAAFSTCTRMFGRTLRILVEVIAALIFAERGTSVDLSQFKDIINMLPFAIPVEFNAGFLMCYILTNTSCTISDLEVTFPQLYSLSEDIGTLFWFWTMSYAALCPILVAEDSDETPLIDRRVLDMANEAMSQSCRRLNINLWRDLFEPQQLQFQVMQQPQMQMQPQIPAQAYMPQMDMRGGMVPPQHQMMYSQQRMNVGGGYYPTG